MNETRAKVNPDKNYHPAAGLAAAETAHEPAVTEFDRSGSDKISILEDQHFIDPAAIISKLDMNPGSIVADFGCGAGFFSIPIAQATGKDGKVYALDILPQALESVESKAKILGISNIVGKRVNLEKNKGSDLPQESVDWVIIKDMFYQNGNKAVILSEARRILKSHGKALIVEWSPKSLGIGPAKKLRISSEKLEAEVRGQNFKIEKIIGAGNFHYAMVAAKA